MSVFIFRHMKIFSEKFEKALEIFGTMCYNVFG